VNAQLFNSPVPKLEWHARDISLAHVDATDRVGPAFTPFDAQMAPMANDPALVALTNEEGHPGRLGFRG
jgi:hypothetical protein